MVHAAHVASQLNDSLVVESTPSIAKQRNAGMDRQGLKTHLVGAAVQFFSKRQGVADLIAIAKHA